MDFLKLVSPHLFGPEGGNVFALLDGASIEGLREKMHALQPPRECLLRGELEPDMEEVAPYLVQLEQGTEFSDWVIGKGWGKHWGVFAITPANLRALRQHFRRFIRVHDEAGKPLFFRYYDPRVLRVFLPTCKPDELNSMFGEVTTFVAEGEKPDVLLKFQNQTGSLQQKEERLVAK